MSELARQHCEPCEKGSSPLEEQAAAKLASDVPGWERESNQKLRREFSFDNFRDAFGFVARVALVAEAEGHHPDIELGWGRVQLCIHTHKIDGLTESDFVLAAKCDRELAAG